MTVRGKNYHHASFHLYVAIVNFDRLPKLLTHVVFLRPHLKYISLAYLGWDENYSGIEFFAQTSTPTHHGVLPSARSPGSDWESRSPAVASGPSVPSPRGSCWSEAPSSWHSSRAGSVQWARVSAARQTAACAPCWHSPAPVYTSPCSLTPVREGTGFKR